MTGSFPVPDSVWMRIKNGEELGDVIDEITGLKGLKRIRCYRYIHKGK
jgi:Protein of unknown function DUF84.